MTDAQYLYNHLADTYDLMIQWDARLKRETPLLQQWFRETGAKRILDAGSGTGKHALLFAGWGLEVVGADPSPEMIARARSQSEGRSIRYLQAGFGELFKRCGGDFDALVCLGNSLAHVLTARALDHALRDFARTLRSGGLLIIHGNNYDAIVGNRERLMPPAQATQGDKEFVFLRFFDFSPRRLIFHVITLIQQEGQWRQHVKATPQRPLFRDDLEKRLSRAGFQDIAFYGSWSGKPFEKLSSDHLIVRAVKQSRKDVP